MTTASEVLDIVHSPSEGATSAQSVLDTLKTLPKSPEAGDIQEGGPGLQDFLARGGMSMMADTAAEALDVFKRYYPAGDLFRNKDDSEFYFRTDADEKYRKVDPSMFDDEGAKADLLYDVADAAGALPALAGDLIAFGVTRNPGALANMRTAALGAGAGELTRQLMQTIKGAQRQDIGDIAAQTGTEMMLAAAGEGAVKPLIAGANIIRGGANLALKAGGAQALKAGEKLGLPGLTPGQVAHNPMVARWEGMGKTISSEFAQKLEAQRNAATKALNTIVESPAGDAVGKVTKLVRVAENAVKSRIKHAPADSDRAGRQILAGVEDWDTKARGLVSAKYDKARAVEPATYDISGLQEAADDILRGVSSMNAEGEAVRISELNPDVETVANLVKGLDPDIPSVEGVDATEQLKVLRQRLWDAKTPSAGENFAQKHRDANNLYNALTDAMNNPVADSAGATALWRDAAKEAGRRFDVLDHAVIGQILKTQRKGGESTIATSLLGSGKQSDVLYVRNLISADRFSVLKGYAAGNILKKPSILQSMDQDVLAALFPDRELTHITGVVDDLAKIRGSDLAKSFAENTKPRMAMREFLEGGTPAQTETFIKAMKNDPGAMAEAKRSVIDGLVEAARKGETVDVAALNGALKAAKDNGLLRIFSTEEMKAINGLRRYLHFSAKSSSDSGTSLVAAQIGSPGQLARGSEPVLSIVGEAVHQMSMLMGFGKIIMSPVGRRALLGTGKAPKRYATLRSLSAAAATLANDQVETE